MAKVYALPTELEAKLPKPDYGAPFTIERRNKEEEEERLFVESVQAWALEQNPTDKYAGVMYRIGMGDGYARYIVLSSSPVKLVHLPLGDAWDSPWADRVLKKDIVQSVERQESLGKIFGRTS